MHDTGEWRALADHRQSLATVHLGDLFGGDPERGPRFTAAAEGLVVDYSKNRLTTETVAMLGALADRAGLRRHIHALLNGEPVNTTEQRPAWHTALRRPDPPPEVAQERERLTAYARQARDGRWRAVVNIGIGGSDLGPAMATAALGAYATDDVDVRFLSNVDGAHFRAVTRGLDPAATLFVVSSKTFSTIETLTNARTARAWVAEAVGPKTARAHFAAVTADPERAREWGIDPESVFRLWDWVGGRYSLASAVGLSLMISIGPDAFTELLAGMHAMDEHFRSAPWAENLPALLGLIGVWNRNFWGWPTHAVLPYAQELALFPAYLQQLDMESNGKSVRADGTPVTTATGPVVWGGPGTNGQHAFHQLLHQGADVVPVDFIGFCRPNHAYAEHHDLLMANLLAQAEALAFGAPDADNPHRRFTGNRPSTVILGDRLAPRTLGQLVALYEHKVFTQATVWGINPFDQWGVELGKSLAADIAGEFADPAVPPGTRRDSSTRSLIDHYLAHRDHVAR
ncbi:glucose-6-phosphate isomerase [Candidatus Poriferisocius sp.]|uniref:glucose-6-phosphate isomerase n=1 Tax=Candidatus Poriferisocius sp. TaxID=3101276 RepID=UPI003B5BA7DC